MLFERMEGQQDVQQPRLFERMQGQQAAQQPQESIRQPWPRLPEPRILVPGKDFILRGLYRMPVPRKDYIDVPGGRVPIPPQNVIYSGGYRMRVGARDPSADWLGTVPLTRENLAAARAQAFGYPQGDPTGEPGYPTEG